MRVVALGAAWNLRLLPVGGHPSFREDDSQRQLERVSRRHLFGKSRIGYVDVAGLDARSRWAHHLRSIGDQRLVLQPRRAGIRDDQIFNHIEGELVPFEAAVFRSTRSPLTF